MYIDNNILYLVAELSTSIGALYIQFAISDITILTDFFFCGIYSKSNFDFSNSMLLSKIFSGEKVGYPLTTKVDITTYMLKLKLLGV